MRMEIDTIAKPIGIWGDVLSTALAGVLAVAIAGASESGWSST